jgi:hypothetical protein
MLLPSLSLALVFPLSLQSGHVTAQAIRNDNPESWVVEYPRIIQPIVARYRRCLNLSDRRVTGEADFEVQHRADIPRCAKQRGEDMAAAAAEMEGAKTSLGTDQLKAVFDTIEAIHVARGRDLDNQFKLRTAATRRAQQTYREQKSPGLVLDLVDASVVKSRAELQSTTNEGGSPYTDTNTRKTPGKVQK